MLGGQPFPALDALLTMLPLHLHCIMALATCFITMKAPTTLISITLAKSDAGYLCVGWN